MDILNKEDLTALMSYDSDDMADILFNSGYDVVEVLSAVFLGISKKHAVYQVTLPEPLRGDLRKEVSVNNKTEVLSAVFIGISKKQAVYQVTLHKPLRGHLRKEV